MTPVQAKEVLMIALEGAVRQQLDDERIAFLALHLAPLPYERTRDSVHRYVANHKWVSTLEELIDACGLPLDDARAGATARTDLVRAVREGGRLVRDLRSVSGWAYVGPGEALPPGAVEAERIAAQPTAAALPPGEPLTDEQRSDNRRRLGDLARTLGARKTPAPPPAPAPRVPAEVIEADLRAFEERRASLERRAR